jgi:hypothetical protein
MSRSTRQFLFWSAAMLMPVWLLILAVVWGRFGLQDLPGTVCAPTFLTSAALSAAVIARTRRSFCARIGLIVASWALLVTEILFLGMVTIARRGLAGIQ